MTSETGKTGSIKSGFSAVDAKQQSCSHYNHRVEEALEAAVEHGDYSIIGRLLEVISTPYAHAREQRNYYKVPKESTRPYQTFCGTRI